MCTSDTNSTREATAATKDHENFHDWKKAILRESLFGQLYALIPETQYKIKRGKSLKGKPKLNSYIIKRESQKMASPMNDFFFFLTATVMENNRNCSSNKRNETPTRPLKKTT